MSSEIYLDGRYAAANPDYHVKDSAWKAQQVCRLLERRRLTPARIAEIGCGAGEILRVLGEAMPGSTRLVGWDISPHAIALCRARSGRPEYVQGDLIEADVEPYDLVLCLDVLEHVEDYLGFLRRLRPKGRDFVFHVPLDLSVQTVLRARPLRLARETVGHLHYFTKETALATLETAGYVVDEWCYTAGALDLPDRSRLQTLARWPRRLGLAILPDLTVRVLGGCSVLVLAH